MELIKDSFSEDVNVPIQVFKRSDTEYVVIVNGNQETIYESQELAFQYASSLTLLRG